MEGAGVGPQSGRHVCSQGGGASLGVLILDLAMQVDICRPSDDAEVRRWLQSCKYGGLDSSMIDCDKARGGFLGSLPPCKLGSDAGQSS